MALDFGYAANILLATETTYGTQSASTAWNRVPVLSFDPGTRQPRENQDVTSYQGGRDGGISLTGLRTIEPTIEVPMDLNNIGHWLHLVFGAPVTTGTTDYVHTFKSGGTTLPSASVERQLGGVGDFLRVLGCRADSLDLTFSPGAAAQSAKIGLVANGRVRTGVSADTSPVDALFLPLLGQATVINRAGSPLARVTGGSIRFSNGLERLREANGGVDIKEAAPGPTTLTGTVDMRMDSDLLIDDAEAGLPIALTFGYSLGPTQSLVFTVPGALVELTDPPVQGRGGIQASFSYTGQYDATAGCRLSAVLKNQVAAYT